MAQNFPNNPSDGDTYEGFTYSSTLGAWRAGSGLTLSALDVITNTPSGNGSLTYSSSNGSFTFTPADATQGGGGGGGASITMADAAPGSPSNGDLWFNTSVLRLYVYYTDGSSNQWVQTNPTGAASAAGGSSTWAEKTSAYTAAAGDNLIIDTTSAVTITLPSTANLGDQIRIVDGTGNAATNNITISRNGHKIQGATTDLTVSTDRAAFGLVYYNAAQGWLLTER